MDAASTNKYEFLIFTPVPADNLIKNVAFIHIQLYICVSMILVLIFLHFLCLTYE